MKGKALITLSQPIAAPDGKFYSYVYGEQAPLTDCDWIGFKGTELRVARTAVVAMYPCGIEEVPEFTLDLTMGRDSEDYEVQDVDNTVSNLAEDRLVTEYATKEIPEKTNDGIDLLSPLTPPDEFDAMERRILKKTAPLREALERRISQEKETLVCTVPLNMPRIDVEAIMKNLNQASKSACDAITKMNESLSKLNFKD